MRRKRSGNKEREEIGDYNEEILPYSRMSEQQPLPTEKDGRRTGERKRENGMKQILLRVKKGTEDML